MSVAQPNPVVLPCWRECTRNELDGVAGPPSKLAILPWAISESNASDTDPARRPFPTFSSCLREFPIKHGALFRPARELRTRRRVAYLQSSSAWISKGMSKAPGGASWLTVTLRMVMMRTRPADFVTILCGIKTPPSLR